MNKQPKFKICRRLGARVFSKCENPRFSPTPKYKSGKNTRRRSLSEYGIQLLDKQKVRFTYNLRERQFAKYVREASAKKGTNPTENLYRSLEARLDNVVFRFGLTKSRAAARQMVSHGHILLNGRRVTIPSIAVRPGDVVLVRPQSKDKVIFSGLSEKLKDYSSPSWLVFDEKKHEGKIKSMPVPDNASAEQLNLTSIIEFYGR